LAFNENFLIEYAKMPFAGKVPGPFNRAESINSQNIAPEIGQNSLFARR